MDFLFGSAPKAETSTTSTVAPQQSALTAYLTQLLQSGAQPAGVQAYTGQFGAPLSGVQQTALGGLNTVGQTATGGVSPGVSGTIDASLAALRQALGFQAPQIGAPQAAPGVGIQAPPIAAPVMGTPTVGAPPTVATPQLTAPTAVAPQGVAPQAAAAPMMTPGVAAPVAPIQTPTINSAQAFQQGVAAPIIQDFQRQVLPALSGAAGRSAGGAYSSDTQLSEGLATQNLGRTLASQSALYDLDTQRANQAAALTTEQANQSAALSKALADLQAQTTAGTTNVGSGLSTNLANLTQAGATAGQNLSSQLSTALANLQAGLTAGTTNVGAQLTTGGQNLQSALTTALANQQAALTSGSTNLESALKAALANQGAGLTAATANQQTGTQVDLANLAARLSTAQGNQGASLTGQGDILSALGLSPAVSQQPATQQADLTQILSAVLAGGGVPQQTAQTQLTGQYQDFLNQITQSQQLKALMASLGVSPTQQTNMVGLPASTGLIQGVLQGASQGAAANPALGTAALAALSDRLMKDNIERIGTLPRTRLPVYSFQYKGSPERHVGLMADEVERVVPAAVKTLPSGFKVVDYFVAAMKEAA